MPGEFALDPAYGIIDYSTDYSIHKHAVPTLAWIPSSITGTMGSYLDHLGTPRDAEAMWDDLIAVLAPIAHTTTTYNQVSIYTKPTPDAPAVLVATKAYTTAGSSVAGGIRKAVQATFNMKTVGGNAFKMVFLDYPHGNSQFDKQFPASFSADALALFGVLSLSANSFCGRDKTKIQSFLTVTNTLNEALRKQYRMG